MLSPLARPRRSRLRSCPRSPRIKPPVPFTAAIPVVPYNLGQLAVFLEVTVVASHGTKYQGIYMCHMNQHFPYHSRLHQFIGLCHGLYLVT